MEVRITFRSEVYIKGKDMGEIRTKWEELGLFSADAIDKYYAEFIEINSVEDADPDGFNDDLMNEWDREFDR